jgi:hypothetical protein
MTVMRKALGIARTRANQPEKRANPWNTNAILKIAD